MELAFKDYLLGVITLVVVYLLYKMMVVEKMTDDVLSDENVHQIVKDTYQFDIQAIRNLGDLAKKIFDKDNGKLIFSHDVEIRGGKLVVSNDKGHERCIISGVGGKTAGGGAIESGKDIIVIPEQNGGNPGLVIGMDMMSGFTKGVSKMTGNVNVNGIGYIKGKEIISRDMKGIRFKGYKWCNGEANYDMYLRSDWRGQNCSHSDGAYQNVTTSARDDNANYWQIV